MQNHSSTKQFRRRQNSPVFRWAPGIFVLAALMITTAARAGLSGTYTIGPSGTYTTLTAAVNDLNSQGVSGAVTFNVAAGTYTEAIQINSFSGSSSTNTVTFKGAGRSKTTIQNGNYVVLLNGCSYVTFDGFNIVNTSSSYTVFLNYANYCSVLNCNMSQPSNATYNIVDQYTLYFTLKNCNVTGGYYSIYRYSSPNSTSYAFNDYENNRFTKFGYYGMYSYYANQATFKNNVIDSSANGYGYGIMSYYETGGNYVGNKVIAKLYYAMYMYDMNYYSSSYTFNIINNVTANEQWYNFFYMYYAGNVKIAHNTMNCLTEWALYAECYYSSGNVQIADNILISNSAGQAAAYYYTYGGSGWPGTFTMLDGNDYINTASGGQLVQVYTGSTTLTYYDIPTYQKALSSSSYTNPYNGSKQAYESYATNMAATFINASGNDYHMNQKVTQPSGVYAGVDVDIDGDARCKLFPTAGVDESTYGKSKPTVKFFLPTNIFPGSPTYIYQTAKAGEPKLNTWYLNGVKVSDSVVLFTNKFVSGTNTLKLVTQSCGGTDSFQQSFNVSPPTAVPGTDFIANKNVIKSGEVISFHDLSSNGPTKWEWSVSPDSVIDGGAKVSAIKFVYGSSTFQNPGIQFNYGGKYTVCLTATNGVGKGAKVCKTNYITVLPSINMGSVSVVKDPRGYLFDNGGPNNNYSRDANNNYTESILLDPCADSVYMTLSLFDLYCGYDYLRIYSGKDNNGTPLWNSKCSQTGYAGYGPGYTGGKYTTNSYQCMPNVNVDTFKAKKSMYIEMTTYEAYNSAGFAAYWWSKPRAATKPKAAFSSSNAGDSVCTNASLSFTNKSTYDPNDVPTYLWDLDGDLTTFECIGACATASYPYFLSGPVNVTLIATNCGGSDTAVRTLTVYNPSKPKAQFTADNTTPTTNDIVYFTSTTVQCVDNFMWTITPSSGTTGKAVYVNGTGNTSQNPQVNFTGTGYYDVKLYVDNASGAQKDSVILTKYINARNAYCIPSVATLNQGLGITAVSINTISNKTSQAATEYSNFVPSMSTSLAIGATYSLTVSRDASLIFEPAVRTAYIDWNGDGSFVGAGEIYELDSNSYAADVITKIKVPKTAKVGATVMRIAINRGAYANKPCGQNEFGEYQDYRIYVTPYNILPVITLTGHQGNKDTIKIEQGYGYTEAGYKATSYLYGDITKDVKVTSRKLGSTNPADSFNNVIPNIYIFSYNVTDSAGNKAVTQTRVVQVTKDKTPPALIVKGPDTTIVEVTKTPMHPVPVPGIVSADDLVDGPLAGTVIVDSAKVQTNIVGDYVVSYTVTDLSGNTAVVYRVVRVIDSIKPVMTLIGPDPEKVEVFMPYTEQGVTVTDNYNTAGQLNSRVQITGNVDTSRLGTYTVTYNVSDLSGNVAKSLTRTVIVVDTLAPTVSINGNTVDSVEVFNSYNDPGVSVSDNYDNAAGITLTVSGTFYSSFPGGKKPNKTGTYTIIYTATDRSGNKASVTRTVKVQDRIAPVINLLGDAAVSICRWFPYVDAGYTVSDNYDNATSIKIDTMGSYFTMGGTTMSNLLYLRYQATDKSGNTSYSGYRYIEVKPETDFTCMSAVKGGMSLDKYITVFPNPSSGVFTINTTLPVQQKVRISVTNMLGQEIAVIHNGVLGQNSFTVDLSNQAGGVYMLNITTDNQTITRRVEIAR